MNRRLLIVFAAVVLTLLGTFVLLIFVSSAEQRAQEGAALATVLVATQEIDPGTPASELSELVGAREVTTNLRASDAVDDIASLEDQVTVDRILQGQPIVARQFGDRSQAGRGSAGRIEEGKQVVTLALEPQRALGGEIGQGDRVGIVVSIGDQQTADGTEASSGSGEESTAMTLGPIEVVDVGGVNNETGEVDQAVMVSVEVDEPEAEKIVFGAEYGSVWLTRQPEDAEAPDDRTQTRDNLFPESRGS